MRFVIKVERLGTVGDMYLASKRMTQIPYCDGINNPDIMIWKTRVAAEKYIATNFSWQPAYLVGTERGTVLDYVIMERE